MHYCSDSQHLVVHDPSFSKNNFRDQLNIRMHISIEIIVMNSSYRLSHPTKNGNYLYEKYTVKKTGISVGVNRIIIKTIHTLQR